MRSSRAKVKMKASQDLVLKASQIELAAGRTTSNCVFEKKKFVYLIWIKMI